MHPTRVFYRSLVIADLSLILFSPLHAQQYGWKVIARPTDHDLNVVEFVNSSYGWCAAADAIYRTSDGGITWIPTTVLFTPCSIAMNDSVVGWAVGYKDSTGKIYKTTNGGRSWVEQLAVAKRSFFSVAAPTVQKITVVGATAPSFPIKGEILQTTDGGLHWTERAVDNSVSRLEKVQFVDPLHGWIRSIPEYSKILRTLDGGNTWGPLLTPGNVAAISFIDRTKGWAIRREAFVFQTSDGGITWNRLSSINYPFFEPSEISFADSLRGWAFGAVTDLYLPYRFKGIFRTNDGGKTWTQEIISSDLSNQGNVVDGEMLDVTYGWAVCNDGNVLRYQLITEVKEKLPRVPQRFDLHQNYPNPFNPTTNIQYSIQKKSPVTLRVYDVLGNLVTTLVNEIQQPGVYRVIFDGSSLASGTYYYTMKAETFSATKQMILAR